MQEDVFENNAGVNGGGLRLEEGSVATVVDSVFVGNMAALGSAVLVHDGATMDTFQGCTVINNTQLLQYSDENGSVFPIQVFSDHAVSIYRHRCDLA